MPTVTHEEYQARLEMWWNTVKPRILMEAVPLLVSALIAYLTLICAERRGNSWLQALVGGAIVLVIVGYSMYRKWEDKRLYVRFGLLCPVCGRVIVDYAGLVKMPHEGRCRHCGTKAIADETSTGLPEPADDLSDRQS